MPTLKSDVKRAKKKANGYPPSPLDSGSASLLPPSAGAEYWWLPAPPPTWRFSESVKAPKYFIQPGWRFRRRNQSPNRPIRYRCLHDFEIIIRGR